MLPLCFIKHDQYFSYLHYIPSRKFWVNLGVVKMLILLFHFIPSSHLEVHKRWLVGCLHFTAPFLPATCICLSPSWGSFQGLGVAKQEKF